MRRGAGQLLLVSLLTAASGPGVRAAEVPPPGHVTLPLSEYRKLHDAAQERRRHPQPAPLAPVLESAALTVTPGDEAVVVETILELTVSSPGNWKLPLPADGALLAWFATPPGAWVASESGKRTICAGKPGRYRISLQAALPISPNAGLSRVTLAAPEASSVSLRVQLASADQDARISEGALARDATGKLLTGTLPRGHSVSLDFRARQREEEVARFTGSRAELFTLGPEENLREGVADVNVLSGKLSTLALRIPKDEQVEAVSGDGVAGFDRDDKDPDRILIGFLPPARGRVRLYWETTRVSPSRFTPALLEHVEGGEAYVAARGEAGLELAAKESPGLERADPKDLPPLVRALLPETAVLLFRVVPAASGAGASLTVESHRLPEVPGRDAVVEAASVTSVFTRSGARLDRWTARLKTRNGTFSWPQPEGSSLWSVFVNGKPVQPSGEGAETKIPLRGSSGSALLDVVISRPGVKFARKGEASLDLALPPAPVVNLAWNLYFPSKLRYRIRDGNLWPSPVEAGIVGELPKASTGLAVRGGIRGKVTDENGGTLPGVTLTLAGPAGGNAVSGSQGEFSFNELLPGIYTINAGLAGFATVQMTYIRISSGRVRDVTIPLKVASVATTITVSSESPLLDTHKQSVGATFGAAELSAPPAAPPGTEAPTPVPLQAPAKVRLQENQPSPVLVAQQFQQGLKSLPIEVPTDGKLIRVEGRLFFGQRPEIRLDYKE